MKVFAVILGLFSFQASAGPLLGTINDPLKILKTIRQLNTNQQSCSLGTNPADLSSYSFNAHLECDYQCDSAKSKMDSLQREFNPNTEGLQPGNGFDPRSPLMTSFSSLLMIWSTEHCLSYAKEKCGSWGKIKKADLLSVSSGNWKITERPNCEKRQGSIYSPYDPRFTLEKASTQPVVAKIEIPKKELGRELKDDAQSKDCSHVISGKVCFGDCMIYNEDYTETKGIALKTDHPSKTEIKKVCADVFFKTYEKESLSPDVAEVLCQNFYLASLIKNSADIVLGGISCAAFRGTADCKSFRR